MLPRIYIILLHLKMGGIEVISVNLANAFNKRGYEVTIISLVKCDELKYKLNKGIRVEYISSLKPSNSYFYKIGWRLMLKRLSHRISKIKNSVIISSNDTFNVLLSKHGDSSSLKIGQLHHDYYGRKDLIRHFQNDYYGLDYFAILTEDVRIEIENIMREHNTITKCITIPNFNPIYLQTSTDLPLCTKKPYCIAVGRLSPEKGFDRLIQIWHIMKKDYNIIPDLLIVGDGIEKQKLHELIMNWGLEDNIFLVGQKDNEEVKSLIKNAVCYCMTSYTEGFPVVLLEALKEGTPQVAFDVRVGPRNLILNNTTGVLVKDGDIKKFSDTVMQIFQNKKLRDSLSVESKKRSEEFSESRVMNLWESIISKFPTNRNGNNYVNCIERN